MAGGAFGALALAMAAMAIGTGAWRAAALAVMLPVAGLVWLAAVRRARNRPLTRRQFTGLIAIGLVARLVLLAPPTLFEDDYVRYLWDGGVTAHGLNPYARSPASVMVEAHPIFAAAATGPKALSATAALGTTSGGVLERVSYPSVTTIYPPLAQLGFAAAHLLRPWSLIAWRIVVLAAECLTIALLVGGLRAAGRSPGWALAYWLCPLPLKEFANGAHMDALLMPVLAGLCWAMVAGRLRLAAVLVGIAAGLKLWPLLLIAALAWRVPRWSERALIAGIALAVAGVVLAPMLASLSPADSGLVAYADGWMRNTLVFPALLWACTALVPEAEAGVLARGLVAAAVCLFTVRAARAAGTGPPLSTIAAWRDAALALLLLSPTGYAWYASWLLPFFIIAPSLPAGLLIACIGGYYARFADPAGLDGPIATLVAPAIGFAPVWAAILIQRLQRRTAHAA